jgi:hypothetical protein
MLDTEQDINQACIAYLQNPIQAQHKIVQDAIAAYVQHLINTNFLGLVQLLYRVDVNEDKITKIAKENILEAHTIANCIIERVCYKLQHIKHNTMPHTDTTTPDWERW